MLTIKKSYQTPSIKVKNIETSNVMAASEGGISVGGDTGIGIGEGNPPTVGAAKSSIFDNSESSDKSFWKE